MDHGNFVCEQCKTLILNTSHGQLNACEHYPLTLLEEGLRNQRSDFLRVLAEFTRAENPVTKSVLRDILKKRLDTSDVS